MIKYLLLFLFPLVSFGQSSLTEVEGFLQNKEYHKAEIYLTKILVKEPTNIKAIELLGDAYSYQEKWEPAISKYQYLVETAPNIAKYHYKYGGAMGMEALRVNKIKAFFMIDDIEEAFLNAVKLDPKHIDARWALIEYYIQLPGIIGGSKSESLKHANALENLSKVDGFLAKGYIYEYSNEPLLAEKYYKKAIEVGGSVTCFQKLSSFYEKNNAPEKSIKTIESASIKLQRNSLNYQLGKVCASYNLELNKGEKCLHTFIDNHSSEDGVPLEWAYFRLAQIFRHKNDKVNATKWIDKSLVLQPNFEIALLEKKLILKM